jgi:hypothetical protein
MRHGRIVKEVFPEAISLTELYELCMKDPAQGMAA